jgi:mono/diheme cytochrome c family protein
MRKQTCILAVLVAACSSGAGGPRLPKTPKGEQVLVVEGKIRGGPYALGDADLAALPQGAVRGQDPRTGREAVWEGTALAALVSGKKRLAKGADTAIVRTSERIAVPIPLTVIRQRKPVLAERADGERIPARVLAWPNLEQAGLPTDPRQPFWWVRDVVAIEVVDWQATLGRALATPQGAPDGARLGADHFGARCIGCHALRGTGGGKGPDLTKVATRLDAGAFRAFIGSHPGWQERGLETPGEEAIDHVWTFLRSIATATGNDARVAGTGVAGEDD